MTELREATPIAAPETPVLRARKNADTAHSLWPVSQSLAWLDWVTHLAASPIKQQELAQLAADHAVQLARTLGGTQEHAADIAPRRLRDPAWNQWPFNAWRKGYLLTQEWWSQATHNVPGVEAHHADLAAFGARLLLEAWNPANQLATNPVALRQTASEAGANLLRGFQHAVEDLKRLQAGMPEAGTQPFRVGRDLAVTPGKVVYRNELIELLQYSPSTAQVRPEPILIVPAWIMKYYILDLSPHNSMIRYLVDQGYTVFCISWKNPGADASDLGMDDYLNSGIHAALLAVNAIVPNVNVHGVGYCLGGTLLTIAAAAMAGKHDTRLASLSLLAAQTDFSEPGELSVFIDESQIAALEAQMQTRGFLTGEQMAAAFQMLRSDELIWARAEHDYLLGQERSMTDLMAWNADTTRMPARMHSEYLRKLFLHNELATNRYQANGEEVRLGALQLPIFCVGTETDHVVPWRSAYKLNFLTPAPITFVLTNGGHNAGIVSEPGHPRRHVRLLTRPAHATAPTPEQCLHQAALHEGSWWPHWTQWLNAQSGTPGPLPSLGKPEQGYPILDDAPGHYVLEK